MHQTLKGEAGLSSWAHPNVPTSIRRPWQVWQEDARPSSVLEESAGAAAVAFCELPVSEQEPYVEVSRMELAAFLAWLLAQACGRASAADVLADAHGRRGVWEQVELAWDRLGEEEKEGWVPAAHGAFLAAATGAFGQGGTAAPVPAPAPPPPGQPSTAPSDPHLTAAVCGGGAPAAARKRLRSKRPRTGHPVICGKAEGGQRQVAQPLPRPGSALPICTGVGGGGRTRVCTKRPPHSYLAVTECKVGQKQRRKVRKAGTSTDCVAVAWRLGGRQKCHWRTC